MPWRRAGAGRRGEGTAHHAPAAARTDSVRALPGRGPLNLPIRVRMSRGACHAEIWILPGPTRPGPIRPKRKVRARWQVHKALVSPSRDQHYRPYNRSARPRTPHSPLPPPPSPFPVV